MLAALRLNSLLNESAGLKDRIIFENVPSSQKYLSTVIQAIRDGKAINVTYQSFRKQAPETLVLEPYFLREYKRKYFKSLPLHQSQEIIEETPEYTVFKYFLTPDWDFRQDVLSFGTRVEVLEPERVRKERCSCKPAAAHSPNCRTGKANLVNENRPTSRIHVENP